MSESLLEPMAVGPSIMAAINNSSARSHAASRHGAPLIPFLVVDYIDDVSEDATCDRDLNFVHRQ